MCAQCQSCCASTGSLVLVVHQWALSCGLIEVAHSDARGPELWHLNKEGLLSLPGYWALSLLSVGLGSFLHPERGRPDQEGVTMPDRWVCRTVWSLLTQHQTERASELQVKPTLLRELLRHMLTFASLVCKE